MKIIPTCREASELLSQAQDRALSVREKFTLYIHLPLCDGCRNFREQLTFMRRAVRQYLGRD
jgi:hypothetical protein